MLGPSSMPLRSLGREVSPVAASAGCAMAHVLGSVALQRHPALAAALLGLQSSALSQRFIWDTH